MQKHINASQKFNGLVVEELKSELGLLTKLMTQFEAKPNLDAIDMEMYNEALKEIERNLKTLRKLRRRYLAGTF